MTLFLSSFSLPVDREDELVRRRMEENGGCFGYIDNVYPCGLFAEKRLAGIEFAPVTIFAGSNGSGKSTLINLIAEKLRLHRMAPFNSGELFSSYAEACEVSFALDDDGNEMHPGDGSAIITSDDVFDYMLSVRANNEEISEAIESGKAEYARLKFGDTIRFGGMEDYEKVRLQVLSRSKTLSRRRFLRREVGTEVRLTSNGETAFDYFDTHIKNDSLMLLDEPENSLSPGMQLRLKAMLEEAARYCGCQLVIATHSPFLLSIDGAKIYDLDSSPVRIRNWFELENVRAYHDFFSRNKKLFE